MHNLKLLLPLFLFLCGTYIACNKDDIRTYGSKYAVTFAGRVVDESGAAIVGAQVRAGVEKGVTDKNGVFRLKPVLADSKNAILYINMVGYFEFSRAYVVQDESIQNVTIQLLKKEQVGSIDAASGGTINVPGGATLAFPANAAAFKTGGVYSGEIRVFARYLDPSDPDLARNMPGDLRCINAAGDDGVLATFGMLGVEIESQSGQALQIAPGSEVEIRMPITSAMAAIAPISIPLWHYDNEQARWLEEGSAQKIGNEYVGTVKHFSFWNCDSFSEVVYMEGRVFLGESPLANVQIRLTVLSNGFLGYGLTDGNGWFGGAIPKDYEMKLEVFFPDLCGVQVLYSQNVGPFTANTVLPDIVFNNITIPTSKISGRLVGCGSASVTNGYLKLDVAGTELFAIPQANGSFEITLANCSNTLACTITGYDLTQLNNSSDIAFTLGASDVNLGDIEVCTALDEYIQYSLDGQPFSNISIDAGIWADTLATTVFHTFISTTDSLITRIGFTFDSNNQAGTFPLNEMSVTPFVADIANSNLSTTVTTAAANVGDHIIGTFGSTFKDQNGTSHTLTGSYRVVRNW